MSSKIEWTDETINPIQDKIKGISGRGYHCTKISEGCLNCYAEAINKRFGNGLPFDNRRTEFEVIQSELEKPMKWKKPRRIFVCSMTDLFHDDIYFDDIDDVFQAIVETNHTFMVLTKRPQRMLEYCKHYTDREIHLPDNLWLGVTAENQKRLEERWQILAKIPASVRFISLEPMLGPVDLFQAGAFEHEGVSGDDQYGIPQDGDYFNSLIDWVIAGGESGLGARPMHPNWPKSVRDQCQDAGVPFFFKAWGEWCLYDKPFYIGCQAPNFHRFENGQWMQRIGKKAAGRLLDGRTWAEYPE